jgi:hypothetical protein
MALRAGTGHIAAGKAMRKIVLINFCALVFAVLAAQGVVAGGPGAEDFRTVADKLRETGLESERAIELLKDITSVGPRLTGSPQEIGRAHV